ncbi:uncharacterized protein PGTG_08247 [Puccinia graminis f. sp. tritici CRL 75-36-700-3]|uniref:ferric-chelate reductase (NADPH) n=3 Tax=Puccinia graminis f. sp. tritici TaxID=56615 RepID=E3KC40_PUCGT|nr:uncharacterized protein PGTG_08247 [Puccinia graminis f. sp. tritici CRL 75-36-700-3]EFP81998.2 hypothetical protein PGTG_08247 [Puccinia graminis f. sp. tritici CRL 75-36-700-3]
MASPAAPPAPGRTPFIPPDYELNEHIADFIGYLTLAVLCFIALLRLPSFIKYRLRATSRPASFIKKGYLLSKNRNETGPPNGGKAQPFADGSPLLRTKFTLIKLYNLKVPYMSALVNHFNLGNCLFLLVYLILLVILSLYKNFEGTRSLENYKRFGLIAISQFPLLFVLSMKNSPLNHITGVGYERLNFIHRSIARIIFIFALIHGALQMNLQHNLTGKIHFKKAPKYGLVALCLLALLNIMGSRVFRNSLYQVFLTLHVFGYITLVVILWLHSQHTRPFLKASIAFLVLDNLLKVVKSRVKRATFTAMPGGLTRIEVHGINDGWRAGQHVFLRVLKGRQIFEKHPFTIANAPNSSTPYGSTDHLLIVAKAAGDYTERIYCLAGHPRENSSDNLGIESKLPSPVDMKDESKGSAVIVPGGLSPSGTSYHVLVDGPYGSFFTDMTRYRTVLLCAGGSGFTYCMAALEDIIGQAAKSGRSLTKHVHVVWSLREPDMIESFGPGIEETIRVAQAHGITVTVKLFLTKANSNSLVERSYLASLELKVDRPIFSQVLNEVASGEALVNGGGLGVGVCGPSGLVEGVSQAVMDLDPNQVQGIGGVKLHSEKFGW